MDFLLAFHENNREKALTLQNELTPADCSFELLSSAETSEPGEFCRKLLSGNRQVVLLVSDNLLKEGKCMFGGLEAVQQLSSSNRLLPIVIDGDYPPEKVPTAFERVGDVIQYLNYWQDEYINLRQKRRHSETAEDQEKINEDLRVVRQVSAEVGEFLRHLRVVKHYPWEQVSANDWELFFHLNQMPEAHARLKTAAARVGGPAIQDEPEPPEEDRSLDGPPTTIEWETTEPVVPPPVEEGEPEELSEEITEEKEPEPEPAKPSETEIEKVEEIFDEAEEEQEKEMIEAKEEEEEHEKEEEEQEQEEVVVDEKKEVAPEIEEPEEAPAILEAAGAKFDQNEIAAGLNLLSQAVEDFPQSATLRYHYAQALLMHAHSPGEATLELEKLVRIAPEHIQSWYLLGELSEMGNQYRQARQYFEHAVYLQPDFTQGLVRLGLLLTSHFEGEEKTAAQYFKQAYKADKENADAYYQYGVLLYEKVGKTEKAIKALRKTLKLQPDHPFANYDLALIYHSKGDREKAYRYYQMAVANNPEVQTPENDEAFYYEAPAEAAQEAPEEVMPEEEPKARKKKKQTTDSQGIVLITGATSGIGRAAAFAFARAGYNLILTGRREDRLEDVQEKLREKYGTRVRILCFDVRDAEEVTEHLNELDESWRDIDILVNNAGLAKGLDPVHEGELHHWEEMIDTNIKGVLFITRVVSPWMVARKKGQIINIGSIAGKEAYQKGNVYCATKFAVDGLTKAMRLDLHKHGIRVSEICPGHVEETEFALVRFDGDVERAKIYQDFKPLNSGDIADIILFIASTPAHVNIQDVVVTAVQQASTTQIDRSGR